MLIGDARAPWTHPLATPLPKTSKTFSERKKIRLVMPLLPSHARIMPVTEKT